MIGLLASGVGILGSAVKGLFSGERKQARKAAKAAKQEAKEAAKVAKSQLEEVGFKKQEAMSQVKVLVAKYWWVPVAIIGIVIIWPMIFGHHSRSRGRRRTTSGWSAWSKRMLAAKRRKKKPIKS